MADSARDSSGVAIDAGEPLSLANICSGVAFPRGAPDSSAISAGFLTVWDMFLSDVAGMNRKRSVKKVRMRTAAMPHAARKEARRMRDSFSGTRMGMSPRMGESLARFSSGSFQSSEGALAVVSASWRREWMARVRARKSWSSGDFATRDSSSAISKGDASPRTHAVMRASSCSSGWMEKGDGLSFMVGKMLKVIG